MKRLHHIVAVVAATGVFGLAIAAPSFALDPTQASASDTPVVSPPVEGPGPAAPHDHVEFMPVSAIRPGMIGVARTIFEGDRLEEFEVEFLGVLKNAIGPQQDMILARLRGPKVEYTGVVSGMSGSPVYVDGKLVGAVSYRIGAFAKEPIAGITPIGEMVKLGPTRPAGSAMRPAATSPGDLLGWLQKGADRSALPLPRAGFTGDAASAMPNLQPIATPLVCSGCDAEALRYYAPAFEVMGLMPTAGGGAISVAAATAGGGGAASGTGAANAAGSLQPSLPLLPGTAIGAALATGDLNLSAIGTLTHVDGNRVYAFGHPMLGTGKLEVPMTQAQIILTFASASASFKIANATAPIGTIVEDRLTAIVGEVGKTPPTLPLTVRVRSGVAMREFHYDIVRDRSWAPVVAALTTANSLLRTTEFNSGDTVALNYRIALDGYPEVHYEELYAGTNPSQPVHALVANDTGGLLGLLFNNPFQDAPVRSAVAEIDLLDPAQVASLTMLSASRNEVRPGETFRVNAVLSSFRGGERTVSYEVTLPEDTPSGELQITVAGGATIDTLDRRVQERQLQQAGNLSDIVRLVSRQRRSHTLYLRVARRAPSAIVRSEILPELPLSVYNVFNNPRLSADSTLLVEAPVMELARDLDVVASGGRRITVKVK